MENNDETPATGGGAGPDSPQTLLPPTGDPATRHPAAGDPGGSVWDPPAYLKLLGRGLEACGLPASVHSATEAAQELRNLSLTSADSDSADILKAQLHLLNGVFAKLIETGIPKPRENLGLIVAALKAQELCNVTAGNIRLEKDLELRCQSASNQYSVDSEKNRLARLRLGRNN